MNIISQNPYRVIGVFANSKTKERVANINRIKAFIKVSRKTEFPLDIKTLLPEINRSLEEVNNAEAYLTLPNDQVKYAQFWFINETSFDEIAFNNLSAGDTDKAVEIWNKRDNLSSLHNRIVISLINKDLQKAILLAEKFYTEYGTAFINSIADNSNLDAEVIGFNFVDKLCNEFGLNNIMPHISKEDWKEHLSSQAITPIIEELQSAVEAAKTSKGKSPDDRYNAGKKLVNQSVLRLLKLKKLIPPTDLQYQIIADKVGLEVLQCGIDYFNGSVDDDAARKAMPLQQYALRVVVGKMAKDRCDENVKILQKIIDELPPEEIAKEVGIIKKKIEQYLNSCKDSKSEHDEDDELFRKIKMRFASSNSSESSKIENGITLIKECAPYLASIKEFEGVDGDNYIYLSSIIVNIVLGRTIDIVNKCLDEYKHLDFNPYSKSISRTELITVLSKAWEVTLYMSVLDTDTKVKERFVSQKNALYTLLWNAKIPRISSVDFKIKTETEIYNNCKTIPEYKNYIQLFPDGKYIIDAKNKVQRLEQIEKEKKHNLLNKINANSSLDELLKLRNECKWNDVLNILDNKCFELCEKRKDFKKYIQTFGTNARHYIQAESSIKKSRYIKYFNIGFLTVAAAVGLAWINPSFFAELNLTIILFSVIYAFCLILASIVGKGKGWRHFLTVIVVCIISAIIGGALEKKIEEDESYKKYIELQSNPSIELCEKYLRDFPNSSYTDSVLELLYNNLNKNDINILTSFSYSYPGTEQAWRADERVSNICDSLYNNARKTNTIVGWKKYQESVPEWRHSDSQHKIDSLENLVWSTESKAWKEAQKQNNLFAYNKYKKLYPKGKHISQAEKKIIDLEVADVYAGDYGSLPSMDKVSYGSGQTTHITVENKTSYTLTILYSGTDSKRLVIKPNKTSSITLKNGVYKIAASVDASNVRKYAGSENLNGGSYESSYYISYSRF